MVDLIAFYLMIALLFYIVFGGADFGAGILELLTPKSRKEEVSQAVNRAISPVWETNHVWVILALVIIFVAFPQAYSTISISFHIPVSLMLLGIVARGCAFTFRYYDPYVDSSHKFYTLIFTVSSILTPFFQGVVAGGLILANFPAQPQSFYDNYVGPWLGVFPFATGVFLCSLCLFNASCFLCAENINDKSRLYFGSKVKLAALACALSGMIAFFAASYSGLPLVNLFFRDSLSLLCLICAGVILISSYFAVHRFSALMLRVCVVALVLVILVGWWSIQYPFMIGFPAGVAHSLHIYEIASPEPVLRGMVFALVAGTILIFPAIYFLIRVFKSR